MLARPLTAASHALVRITALAAVAAVAALTAPATLRAQGLEAPRPATNPVGLYYQGRAGATEFRPQEGKSYYGMGGGGQIGYNLTRHLGLFVGFDYARPGIDAVEISEPGFTADDNFTFTHVELGGRLNIPVSRWVLPSVDAAYARRALSYSFLSGEGGSATVGRLKYSGNNVLVGTGAQLFVRPTVAVDVGGRVSFGELDHAHLDMRGGEYSTRSIGDSDLTFSRVSAGFTWYFPKFRYDQ
jgi:hypothetical protein